MNATPRQYVPRYVNRLCVGGPADGYQVGISSHTMEMYGEERDGEDWVHVYTVEDNGERLLYLGLHRTTERWPRDGD